MVKSPKDFDNQSYNLSVIGKNLEITKPIKDYVSEKLKKIETINNLIIEANVKLDVQKINHIVDIILKFSHFKVKVRATTENMYSAIDKAFDRLYSKVRKWKSRIQDHHAKGVSVTEMEVSVLENAQDELEDLNNEIIEENNESLKSAYAPPLVIKKKKRPLKVLNTDEAVMKMELSDDNFMIYKSEEEQLLKIIYRRRDSSYGIISP